MTGTPILSIVLAFVSLFLASPALAAIPAGFAPSQIWLSQSTPIAGSSVRVYTVVYNANQTSIEGSVSFKINDSVIGSSPFRLEAGESVIESASWVPNEGSYTASAEITSAGSKNSTQTATATTTSSSILSVTVLPRTPKPPTVEASDSVQTIVASSSPTLFSVISATTATTESIRKAGETYLTSLAGESIPKSTATAIKKDGVVLGADTEALETTPTKEDGGYLQAIAKTFLPFFRYPALFYPVILGIILFVLWLVTIRFRNPRRR